MKKSTFKKVIYAVLALVTFGLMTGFIPGLALTGITIAMAAGSGVVSQETITTDVANATSADLLRPDISKVITKMAPHIAPLDTLIREAGAHEKAEAWKVEFYSSDMRDVRDDLASQLTKPSNPQPSAYDIVVGKVHIWQVDDIVLFNGITTDTQDGKELVGQVIKRVASTSTLTVQLLNGSGSAPYSVLPATIASATKLTRIGNAKNELAAKTTPYGTMPTKAYNYNQIHMAQVEESFYERMHLKEVKWDIQDMKSQAIFDLRRSMEFTSLFGYRNYIQDSESDQYKYFSHGVTRYITKGLDYISGSLDVPTLNGWAKDIFVGNAGADRRYMFVGSDLMEQLSNIDGITKFQDANKTEVVHGITFNRILTNFGELYIKHHLLLDDVSWADAGIVLDLNNIRKRVWKPMETRKLMLKETGESNADAYVLDETFCLELRYPDTHAIIRKASGG